MDPRPDNRWLIVGLGNPGSRYEKTRHNLGFMLIDLLAREARISIKREECGSLIGRARIEDSVIELAKPQTFMNLSGGAVSCLIRKPGRCIENLIVVSDDLALPYGTIRVRPKGSHGGHNGLRSIIGSLGTSEFARMRIGIQPEYPVTNASLFVLETFSKNEVETIQSVLGRGAEAIRSIINGGIEKAMTEFN